MPFTVPGISHVPEPLRVLMALAIGLFLILLRLDAERFGAAEYDDVDADGNRPSLLRRLAWYVVGVVGIAAVLVLHPAVGAADTGGELRVLKLLLAELPLKTAVKLTADITGASRNVLYEAALNLKKAEI